MFRVAVILNLDTEHGRGILRGIARFFRVHPEIAVLKFGRNALRSTGDLRRLRLDGVIARVGGISEERMLTALGIPVVNVSGGRELPEVPTVNTDDVLVGRMAARHLISRGYRWLAFCGDRNHLASRRRRSGFAAEARARGLPPILGLDSAGIAWGSPQAGFEEALSARLSRLPRPIGIFAFTDPVAILVADACARTGLRVPQDVAVLGVGNDLTRLEFAHIDVSSIQLNTGRIGERAAESLFSWLGDARRPAPELLLPPQKIVTRRSTDLFVVDDETVAQALEHIQANSGNPVYVADVARAAGVSRRVLELRFRSHLGTSVYAEVQRVHFEQALELMAEPDLTIGEIAYGAGFDSAQRFSLAFRKRYGVPPGVHRRVLLDGRASGPAA